jgi:hypothetical protein
VTLSSARRPAGPELRHVDLRNLIEPSSTQGGEQATQPRCESRTDRDRPITTSRKGIESHETSYVLDRIRDADDMSTVVECDPTESRVRARWGCQNNDVGVVRYIAPHSNVDVVTERPSNTGHDTIVAVHHYQISGIHPPEQKPSHAGSNRAETDNADPSVRAVRHGEDSSR